MVHQELRLLLAFINAVIWCASLSYFVGFTIKKANFNVCCFPILRTLWKGRGEIQAGTEKLGRQRKQIGRG